MMAADFKDLLVWQKAMDLAEMGYALVKRLPKDEQFELSSQIRRAAVSIPSNIAEGQGRKSNREFMRFLSIARGSRAELETQLMLAQRLGYVTKEQIVPAILLCNEVGRMLHALMQSVSSVYGFSR